MRSLEPWNLSLAGVSLRNADLRSMNFSQSSFEDFLQVDGTGYFLEADLTGITYNLLTEWPFGFTPPPSASTSEDSP
jgi:uncharacterized protein YjbI with pentapeptide repeats